MYPLPPEKTEGQAFATHLQGRDLVTREVEPNSSDGIRSKEILLFSQLLLILFRCGY